MQSPEQGLSEGYAKSRARVGLCTRSIKRWIYIPSSNRFAVSGGRWTRRENAQSETESKTELRLLRRAYTTPEMIIFLRSATEQDKEDHHEE